MEMLREFRIWFTTKWGYNAALIEKETSLEFKTVPINSFIPSLLLSLIFIIVGIFILKRQPGHWYVTVVFWVFAGILLAKTKYVTYIFDKIEGNLLVIVYTISGRNTLDFWLDEIEQLTIQETHDLQAWTSDVQLYLYLTEGRRLKLFGGQIFGIRKELKYFIHEKLITFLNLSEDGKHKRYTRRRTSSTPSKMQFNNNLVGDSPEDRKKRRNSNSPRRRDSTSFSSSDPMGGITIPNFDDPL